jgi:hypothetical protein
LIGVFRLAVEIRYLDPASEEAKALSEEIEKHIAETKARIAASGYTSFEGVYFDEDGEPKSINPEFD